MHENMSHERATELLPWLVNNSLEESERDGVLEHASSCVICRRELTELKRLSKSIANSVEPATIPVPDMRRINARIDAREQSGQALLERLKALAGHPWRVAFAMQTLLLIVLGGALLLPWDNDRGFRTLTAPESLPAGHYVRVVLDPDLPPIELTALLERMDLKVIDGPSNRGVYTLQIPESLAEIERKDLLATLSAHPSVLFAQPVIRGREM